MKTVTSKDGTTIAFDQIGNGPLVILVDSALADRTLCAKLAKLLAEEFTVINYDRRGRGDSVAGDEHVAPRRQYRYTTLRSAA